MKKPCEHHYLEYKTKLVDASGYFGKKQVFLIRCQQCKVELELQDYQIRTLHSISTNGLEYQPF